MELRGFYRVPRWVDAQKILFFLFVPFGHRLWNWILVLSHYCDRCCNLYEVHLFFIIFFGHLFWVLVLKGLVGLHRIVQLQLTQHYWLGHRLGLPWYWNGLPWKWTDHSVVFEIASKYCISDSFVDHDDDSISSKGFLPTVVDITVIWVIFTHSSPF